MATSHISSDPAAKAAQIGSDAGRVLGEQLGAAAGETIARVAEETTQQVKDSARALISDTKSLAVTRARALPTELSSRACELAERRPIEALTLAVSTGFVLGMRMRLLGLVAPTLIAYSLGRMSGQGTATA